MSILFGLQHADGTAANPASVYAMSRATSRWASNGTFVSTSSCVGMGIQPYRIKDSEPLQTHPTLDVAGNMLTLDGRIDNRDELSDILGLESLYATDAEIVLTSFRRWGEECFSRLIGDWAIVIWCQREQSLYLARDHAGTRSLYYSLADDRIIWATYLETLIAPPYERRLHLDYVTRFVCCLPMESLTPYRSIFAVPHNHYIKIHDGSVFSTRHWESTSEAVIRYGSEIDYEEQFRMLFRQAVHRRLDGGSAVLAELSGGLDSSSIVCMADTIRNSINAPIHHPLDTVSYFVDTEKSWNERPYVEAVETARGIHGYHVDASPFPPSFQCSSVPYPLPGASKVTLEREQALASTIGHSKYRAILSGVGGDEVLGGNPQESLVLAVDVLERRYLTFFRQAVSWSLAKRTPLICTVREALQYAYSCPQQTIRNVGFQEVPWLRIDEPDGTSCLVRQTQPFYRRRSHSLRKAHNESALSSIVETMPHTMHPFLYRREVRYPYLDRDLLNFLFNIPQEQLAIPGRRRSLMRRALRGIVPAAVLERRRKAFILRSPLASLRGAQAEIERLFRESFLIDHRLIDADIFLDAVGKVIRGIDQHRWVPVMRTIEMELWLQAGASNGATQVSV